MAEAAPGAAAVLLGAAEVPEEDLADLVEEASVEVEPVVVGKFSKSFLFKV